MAELLTCHLVNWCTVSARKGLIMAPAENWNRWISPSSGHLFATNLSWHHKSEGSSEEIGFSYGYGYGISYVFGGRGSIDSQGKRVCSCLGLGRADSILVLTIRPCYQAMLEDFFGREDSRQSWTCTHRSWWSRSCLYPKGPHVLFSRISLGSWCSLQVSWAVKLGQCCSSPRHHASSLTWVYHCNVGDRAWSISVYNCWQGMIP